jgi:signal transduction histidine kinase
LRGIDGYSHLLIADYSEHLPNEARSFLGTIRSSTNEMNQLIDDLLAYSRLERREFKPERIDLNRLINKLVEQKKREHSQHQLDFVVNVSAGMIVGDEDALSQSLRNYLDNAVKFTQRVPLPRIEVGAKETSNGCVLWVSDNGIGFDSKHHDQIFGMFQRLNQSEEYQGTGIGLAIVRKAMQRMGGRAWAESSLGQGATFYLEIPIETDRDLEINDATEQTNPPTNVDQVIRPNQASSVASEFSIQKKG